MAINGVYHFLYYFLLKKIPIKDVPSGLEDDVFDLPDIELGKYALQLPPPTDTDPDRAVFLSKYLNTSHENASEQTSEMQSFEKQPLIAEISTRLDGAKIQIMSRNIRLQKIEGILQALQLGLGHDNSAVPSNQSESRFLATSSLAATNQEVSPDGAAAKRNQKSGPVDGSFLLDSVEVALSLSS